MTADAAVGSGIATVTVNAIAGLGISEGSGSKATGATGLDFVGPLIGVDASSNTGISTVRVDALTIKDEGSTVGTAGSITTINFVGSGIAAAVSGDTATVTSLVVLQLMMSLLWRLLWDDYKYLNGDITPFNYKKWLILLN